MKNDPYSRLGGLDQLLFKEDPSKQRNNATTEQRANAPTLSRDNAAAGEQTNEATSQRDNAPAKPRGSEPAPQRSVASTTQRGNEATRTRVSAPSGHRPQARKIERHSHDIYLDQVRWMNRLKLEFEEQYGLRLTSNAMVALAVDRFRADYDLNGDDSALMRILVRGDTPREEDGV